MRQPTRKLILEYLGRRQLRNAIPPSLRDIAADTGTSMTNVRWHMNVMERQGVITVQRDEFDVARPRSVRLTATPFQKIQVVGTIDAKGIHLD